MNAAEETVIGAHPFVTIFADKSGIRINAARPMAFAEIERVLRQAPTKPEKEQLPLLKLAKFGDMRSVRNSLRSNENVVAIYGTEGDYDGESVPMEHAAETLSAAGVEALLYTTATHTPERPRWRVIAPLSYALQGDLDALREQHAHWTGVLNALLGGVLTDESFVLSQSYFFGGIEGKPCPTVIRLTGCCLDQLEAIPTPQIPSSDAKPNHEDEKGQAAEHLLGIAGGKHIYQATLRYSGRLIAKGIPPSEVLELLQGYLLGHKAAWSTDAEHLKRWQEVWDKLPRMVNGGEKFAPDETEADDPPPDWPVPVNILSELSAPEFTADELPPPHLRPLPALIRA